MIEKYIERYRSLSKSQNVQKIFLLKMISHQKLLKRAKSFNVLETKIYLNLMMKVINEIFLSNQNNAQKNGLKI